jgi:predicted nucleic acid-binding protein
LEGCGQRGTPLTRLLIDASAAAAWLLPSQCTPASEALLDDAPSHVFAAPHIFPAEIRNALLSLEWKGRLTSDETTRAMMILLSFGIGIEPPPTAYDDILDLARREDLTVYDTTYLWDAMRGGFTLASRDADLLAAAVRNGVPVEDLRRA